MKNTRTINLDTAEYGEIIQFAESRGYKRSQAAIQRESEEGSVGQHGITLDEAVSFLRTCGF